MLAPGSPQDPVQLIDVRDLGAFLVRLIEDKATGVFNALGPDKPLTIGQMLAACKRAAQSDATFTWVDADFLKKQAVHAWSDMPVWVPSSGDTAGFARVSATRAPEGGADFPSDRRDRQGHARLVLHPARRPPRQAAQPVSPRTAKPRSSPPGRHAPKNPERHTTLRSKTTHVRTKRRPHTPRLGPVTTHVRTRTRDHARECVVQTGRKSSNLGRQPDPRWQSCREPALKRIRPHSSPAISELS